VVLTRDLGADPFVAGGGPDPAGPTQDDLSAGAD